MASGRAMGATALAELWARIKAYVDAQTAGLTSPPVGYCLVNSGTSPSDDGYSGTWELVCVTDLGGGWLWPAEDVYPSDSLYAHPVGAEFWVWRRTA